MSSLLIFKSSAMAVVGSLAESKFVTDSPHFSRSGVTPMILMGLGFWVTAQGFTVGQARKKYTELALKDGEKDVEERYGLPNLYAQGTSIHAKAFNCVQRSHQHIFETYTQVALAALVGSVSYPLTAAILTTVYAVGRSKFTQGYAASEGDSSKRYASPLAVAMWYGTLSLYVLGFLSSVKMMIGNKMW